MKVAKRMILTLVALSLTTASWPSQVCSADNSEEAVRLDSVKVTAQKREENVQDIPAAVDVIDSETIKDAGIDNMEELYHFTPNLYRSGCYVEHGFVIRGVKKYMSSPDANVALYMDDVPIPIHYAHNVDLMDIERIEVIRGPQGTLYGMNSEAGVINIVTKKPSNEFNFKTFAEYGTANTSRLGGMANLPLIEDTLSLRLALQQDKTDGHVTNTWTDNDKAAEKQHRNVRGELSWTPASPWELRLVGDYFKANDNIMDVRATAGPLAKVGYLESDYDYELYSTQEGWSLNLVTKRKGDDLDFLSVTGFRSFRNSFNQDVDVSSSPIFYYGENDNVYEDTMFTQEIRLTSPEGAETLQWVLGFFGYLENLDITTADYMRKVGPNPTKFVDNDIDKKGAAIFGEATYTLFDDLHLTGGLRVAYDLLDGKAKNTVTGVSLKDSMHTLEFIPKVSIAYDLSEQAMTYASLSRGFMSGGFRYFNPTDLETYTYKPEYTWNYELGLKTSWLDNRLTANLAAFYIQIEDKQVSDWDPVTGKSQTINAAKAHSKGFELEVSAIPAQGWTVFGGFGFTDARIDEMMLSDGFDYTDNRMPDVPRFTLNLGTQYNHESGYYGRIDFNSIGSFTGDLKNRSREDGYELVNVKVGKEWDIGALYLWCNNVFNEKYHKSVFAWDMSGTGTDRQAIDGDPRTFGVGGSLKF